MALNDEMKNKTSGGAEVLRTFAGWSPGHFAGESVQATRMAQFDGQQKSPVVSSVSR